MVMILAATNLSMQPATIQAAQKKTNVINLNVTQKQMYVGQKYSLKVKTSKASKAVNWKSSNKKTAIVSNKGTVHAKKAGTVKITVTSKVTNMHFMFRYCYGLVRIDAPRKSGSVTTDLPDNGKSCTDFSGRTYTTLPQNATTCNTLYRELNITNTKPSIDWMDGSEKEEYFWS